MATRSISCGQQTRFAQNIAFTKDSGANLCFCKNAHSKFQSKPVGFATRSAKPITASTDTEVTSKPISARSTGLALMLDDGTRKSHSVAENTSFVTGFFKGIASKDSFAQLVAGLYFVYTAMEDSFQNSTDKDVKVMDFPELRRIPSLERDMEYFFGSNWKSEVKPSPAVKAYVDRILTIADSEPKLLIAHQYTRYLGDLFGGQMMGGMATRSLQLEDGQGVTFYQFDDIPDAKQFIEQWYSTLNDLELSTEQKEVIVDEANLVFALNIDLLSELDGNAFSSVFTLAWSALKERLGFN